MGAVRKPRCQTGRLNAAVCRDARERRSDGDVDKAMDGLINRRLVLFFSSAFDAINEADGEKDKAAQNAEYSGQPGEHRGNIFIAFQRKRNEQRP